MYAIIRTGGKQYRVEEGRALSVERLPVEEGATVELRDVLLIADDGQVIVGTPMIEGARVVAQVEAHGRAKKIIVFKYKAKVRTRKKTGHRQGFSWLTVQEILRPGQESKAAKPKARRRKAEAEEETPAPEAQIEAPPAEAIAEAPAPKRRARRVTPSAESAVETPAALPAPKRRAARKPAKPAGRAAKPPVARKQSEKPAPRRRIIRKKSKETE